MKRIAVTLGLTAATLIGTMGSAQAIATGPAPIRTAPVTAPAPAYVQVCLGQPFDHIYHAGTGLYCVPRSQLRKHRRHHRHTVRPCERKARCF
jgi:hypothetical protein